MKLYKLSGQALAVVKGLLELYGKECTTGADIGLSAAADSVESINSPLQHLANKSLGTVNYLLNKPVVEKLVYSSDAKGLVGTGQLYIFTESIVTRQFSYFICIDVAGNIHYIEPAQIKFV